MSRYFETVYFPLLNNIFKCAQRQEETQKQFKTLKEMDSTIKEKSQKISNLKKYQNKPMLKSSISKRKRQEFKKEQDFDYLSKSMRFNRAQQAEAYNEVYGFRDMSSQIDPSLLTNRNNCKDAELGFIDNYSQSFKQRQPKPTSTASPKKQNTKFHSELQQSLASNAASARKTQRLSFIFQSTRKRKNQKLHSKFFPNSTKPKKLIDHDLDEQSIRRLRKNFYLKVVEDDEWEDFCSKNKKRKNDCNNEDRWSD